jgi:collagenase-like PrtC family protease
MNYSRILEHAIESLKSEGRHNQADILRDVLQAYNAQVDAIQAARRVLTDGHSESPYYMDLRDHDETLVALAAALDKLGG